MSLAPRRGDRASCLWHLDGGLGRFLSLDPTRRSQDPRRPQSWNRYVYALNNPLRFIDPNGLEPLDAVLLQFFNAAPGGDFSKVNVNLDSRRVPSGFEGLTFGRQVYLTPGASNEYRDRDLQGIALVGHELVHVQQYRQYGKIGFLRRYFGQYRQNRKRGQSKTEAYRNIVFEEQGRRFQASVTSFLEANPEILGKLQAGTELSASDLQAISQAFEEALAASELERGLQFIQGELVYVYAPE